jgi:hypothetical protein
MGIPTKSLLDQFEERRAEASLLFQSSRDGSAQDRWVTELSEKLGAAIHFIQRFTQRSPQGTVEGGGIDPLYGDIPNPAYQDDLVKLNMRAIIDHKPSRQSLKKFGVMEDRDVVFWIPRAELTKYGLVTERRFRGADIGDLIVWDGTWYIAQNVHRDHYFGQSDKFFFVGVFANRYVHDSMGKEGPVSEYRV